MGLKIMTKPNDKLKNDTEKLLKVKCSLYMITRALSQYNSFNFWGWLEGIHNNNLEIVSGDVRDPSFCRELVRGADTVFHLAALIAIPYSYVAPDSYVDTNIRGTLNMLEAVKAEGCGRLLVTSTSEVYGTAQYVPIDELHPRQPQSPYSATKIGADALGEGAVTVGSHIQRGKIAVARVDKGSGAPLQRIETVGPRCGYRQQNQRCQQIWGL
mgnify:CR=1 FL=1